MINRRTFVKLSAGSVAATMVVPALAIGKPESESIKTLIVYHEDSTEALAFFEKVLSRGAEVFKISGELEPADKQEFLRRLTRQPSTVIGLTDHRTAFELRMAANDAFHFTVPEERFRIDRNEDETLVAWAVAPIAEIREGNAK